MIARKKWVNPISATRRKSLAEYRKVRALYLKAHRFCEICPKRKPSKSAKLASDIHHTHGRAGHLLTDQSHFLAVCRECHNWIEGNRGIARSNGWLAPLGSWNSPQPLKG